MPVARIATWDIEKMMKRLETLRAGNARQKLKAEVEEAQFRENLEQRLGAGEHIHLKAMEIEECINPAGKCWEGPRNVRRT